MRRIALVLQCFQDVDERGLFAFHAQSIALYDVPFLVHDSKKDSPLYGA
jgi:hypothetical protein